MPASRIYNPFTSSSGGGGSVDPNAEETKTFPFAFNTVSPATIFSIPAGARVISVRIAITTAFNDAAATLKIGDAGLNDRLMPITDNVPNEIAEYESNNAFTYAVVTPVLLTIAAGASTQGAGFVVIEYNLNN